VNIAMDGIHTNDDVHVYKQATADSATLGSEFGPRGPSSCIPPRCIGLVLLFVLVECSTPEIESVAMSLQTWLSKF
jgi:hypothetical protein